MKVKEVIERYKFYKISRYCIQFNDCVLISDKKDLDDSPKLLNTEASDFSLVRERDKYPSLYIMIDKYIYSSIPEWK